MADGTRQVTARGLTFDVRVEGPHDGAPVLLLHGFPQHSGQWHAVAPALHAAGLRTVAPDQRGYSPGARPADVDAYRMDECMADALALLSTLDIETAHVVGHDWGAIVGWYLAVTHPGRVRTLTALSVPHPLAYARAIATDPQQQERAAYLQLFRIPGKAEQVLLAEGARRLRAIFVGLDPTLVEGYVRPLLEPGALTAALAWSRAVSPADAEGLGPVPVPTTYLWSDDDAAVAESAAYACAAHVTGDYRFVPLTGAGHWLTDVVPDAVAEAVLARVGAA
ncbi:MAG TPA: alpha/beta hydrolase [Micromonosporaceae bacterium]|nr:alpha/beta hydrolase [Micromonosporaceae bacterium]